MSKIRVEMSLKSKDNDLHIISEGIKSGNRINYQEENVKVTLTISNDKVEMERVAKEYRVKLVFSISKKELSTYKLIGHDEFLLDVDTKLLEISDNKIKIDYTLEENEFSYVLNMEDL